MKTFLVADHSGRGINSKITLPEFASRGWDLTYLNDPEDENEPTLGEWLQGAELGDVYLHEEDRCEITCIDDGKDS